MRTHSILFVLFITISLSSLSAHCFAQNYNATAFNINGDKLTLLFDEDMLLPLFKQVRINS